MSVVVVVVVLRVITIRSVLLYCFYFFYHYIIRAGRGVLLLPASLLIAPVARPHTKLHALRSTANMFCVRGGNPIPKKNNNSAHVVVVGARRKHRDDGRFPTVIVIRATIT